MKREECTWTTTVAEATWAIEHGTGDRGNSLASLVELAYTGHIQDLDEQSGNILPDTISPILVRQMIVADVACLNERSTWPEIVFEAARVLADGDADRRPWAIASISKLAEIADKWQDQETGVCVSCVYIH